MSHQSARDPVEADVVRAVEKAFAAACEALEPLGEGALLLLGCSAGGDSMALLDLAARLTQKNDWKLIVAHFDHAQRPQSAEDAAFVARQCEERMIAFDTERMERADGGEGPLNEDKLRRARYAFFQRSSERYGVRTLVLAHQADDRAETFLMRLLAGSGPTGLGAIRPVEQIEGLTVARPLLGLRREPLRAYLRARGLDWREDPSNEDERHKRVWVRRRVMPLFNERMRIDVTGRIVRASELVEEEAAALDEACAIFLARLCKPADLPATERLDLSDALWRNASEGLRRRLMRGWLWRLRRSAHPPGFEAVREALNFAQSGSGGGPLRTIERIHLVKRDGELVAYPTGAPVPPV